MRISITIVLPTPTVTAIPDPIIIFGTTDTTYEVVAPAFVVSMLRLLVTVTSASI